MKNVIILTILSTLIALPLHVCFAQEAMDEQFYQAAVELDPEARSEFLELIREPGQFEETFSELEIDPGLADRIEQRLSLTNQRHNTDHALETLDKVTDVIGAHLEKLASQHAGKSREALEKALMKRTEGLSKAIEAVSGAKMPDHSDLPEQAQADPGANTPDPGNGVIGGGNGGAGAGGAGGVGGGGAGGVGGGGAGGVGGGAGGAGGGADNGKGKK